jgi:hypothetical protein
MTNSRDKDYSKDPAYQLIEQYVLALKAQHDKEQALSDCMQALSPENAVFSLQCEEMQTLLSTFALKVFGETAVDWLGWWMWECDFGEKPAVMWLDSDEFDVSRLEDLYEHCLREPKTQKPQP